MKACEYGPSAFYGGAVNAGNAEAAENRRIYFFWQQFSAC